MSTSTTDIHDIIQIGDMSEVEQSINQEEEHPTKSDDGIDSKISLADPIGNYVIHYALDDFTDVPDATKLKKKLEPIISEPTKQEVFTSAIERMTSMLNVVQLYYQKISAVKAKHMFDGVKDQTSTNNAMETFYKLMDLYMRHTEDGKDELVKLYKPKETDPANFEEFYILEINNESVFGCPIVFPLLKHLSEIENIYKIDWNIYQINDQVSENNNENEHLEINSNHT
jgi:hypothetical protein